jgi:hypothetical protein
MMIWMDGWMSKRYFKDFTADGGVELARKKSIRILWIIGMYYLLPFI